jgi:parallel beta-helix repeat protein
MRRRVATLATAAFTLALLVPVASASATSAVHVRPGQSIQAAIDRAPAGAVIQVARGTYPGTLEVARSVHLVGDHAVIVPGASDSFCLADWAFSGVVGVCVHGAVDLNNNGSVTTPISNVSIEGLTVKGFAGPGIVAIGVDGFRAEDLVTSHNGEMGMFINTVSNASVLDSRSYGNHGDGIFVENSSANLVVSESTSYGNLGSGIFFMNSLGGKLLGNDLHGNCAGIVVASVAIYGPAPASGDLSVRRNEITANNRLCPEVPYQAPAYGGIGIALIGARNTTVARNDVRNNRSQADSAVPGGGIMILDGAMFGADAPTGNTVRSNHLSGNTPFDVSCDGSGTLNTVRGNSGTSSGC